MDLPASTGHSYSAPKGSEVVRLDFHDTDMFFYEQLFNRVSASTERNNLSIDADEAVSWKFFSNCSGQAFLQHFVRKSHPAYLVSNGVF